MAGERVFLSHAWADQSADRAAGNSRRALTPVLRDHLAARGLSVFYDEEAIDDLDDIAERIEHGLADATLLICWYSDLYRKRRACDWELTAAVTSDPSRIVVVNPEPQVEHILPASLQDHLIPSVPDQEDEAAWMHLADRIARKAAEVGGTFGDVRQPHRTRWYGDPPTRFSRFVGRAEPIWQLDSLLRPTAPPGGGAPAPPAVVVHGLGGVGKTALCCEYAMRFAGAYPAGIFWLRPAPVGAIDAETYSAYSAASRGSQLITIAEQLGAHQPASEEEAVLTPTRALEVIRRYLLEQPGPGLWVIDDLPDGLRAPDVVAWLPPAGTCRALITTQGTTYRTYPNLMLDVMSQDESAELLLSQMTGTTEADRAAASVLAERLGHLPMALDVVGSFAALPGSSPEELLAEGAQPLALVEEAATNAFAAISPTEHELSVHSTLGASIHRLDDASFSLLATASAVNVGPLPVRVLRQVAEVVTGLESGQFRTALGTLMSRSLARSVDAEAFEVHSLVGSVALALVSHVDEFTSGCMTETVHTVLNEVGDVEDVRTHLRSRRTAQFGQALVYGAHGLPDPRAEVDLLRTLGRFLHVETRYLDAVALETRALDLAQHSLADDERLRWIVMNNLGVTLGHIDRRDEALSYLRTSSLEFEARFGSDDPDTLSAKHNLATRLLDIDRKESVRLGLEVYESRQRTLGMDHFHTLFSLQTLLSHQVVPPQYPDATAAYEDLVERRTRTQGGDHTTTLTSISEYAQHLVGIGRPQAAAPLLRTLIGLREHLLGADHPLSWAGRTRLAGALLASSSGVNEEAETLMAGIQSWQPPAWAHFKANSWVITLSNVGDTLRRAGRTEAAAQVFETALRMLGPEPSRTVLLVRHNLAATHADQGDLMRARAEYGELIPQMTALLGEADRLTRRGRRMQAIVLARTEPGQNAVDGQRRLAEEWRASAGEQSPEYAEALGDLADTLTLLGRTSEAARCRDLQNATGAVGTMGTNRLVWNVGEPVSHEWRTGTLVSAPALMGLHHSARPISPPRSRPAPPPSLPRDRPDFD